MNWMTRWPGSFPVFFAEASGATVTDVDGHRYADLCLGDTGAMTGHSPAATVEAVEERLRTGITTMLPSSDSIAVGEELRRRFGLPAMAGHGVGDRREPVRDPARSRDHRPSARCSSSTTATTAPSTRPW